VLDFMVFLLWISIGLPVRQPQWTTRSLR